MCGIYGVWQLDGACPSDSALAAMGESLHHRGPDAGGVWVRNGLGLGHRRLAILDLSPSANQPMHDPSGRYVIVFGGEIYNFQEERSKLIDSGYTFKTQGDTEVILALYDQFGVECLQHLRGMFAFALYDIEKDILLLARDRVGKKPLYYTFDGRTLVFASEPKAIFASKLVTPQPDFDQLSAFLQLGYVPHRRSAFAGVQSVSPGSYVTVTGAGQTQERRYWSLDYRHKERRSEAEWKERLTATLEDAVRLRLVSDVPLGAFLSGGIDSSAVVALMSRAQSRVKTFSIGFGAAEYDERRYARLVARRFDTEHHEFEVEPKPDDLIPLLTWHYDEPFGDPSALPSLCVSRIARQQGGVTVALNGDGGDENFGGYERYRGYQLARLAAGVPGIAQFAGTGRLLPAGGYGSLMRRGKRFLDIVGTAGAGRDGALYESFMTKFRRGEIAALLGPAWPQADRRDDRPLRALIRDAEHYSGVDRVLAVDFASYLPDDLLVKMDRASMAFSLEARSPFLDHVLLEETARMPASLKLRGFTLKYMLKAMMRGVLPDEILDRPKRGFVVPLEDWFRGPLACWLRETVLGGELVRRGLLAEGGVAALIDRHQQRAENRADQLWLLVVLELWWRRFFGG